VETAPEISVVIRKSRDRNDNMPQHVVELIKGACLAIDDPKICCLGLTYKANVDDIRESPAIDIVNILRQEKFKVTVFDPHVKPGTLADQVSDLATAVAGSDVVALLVDHFEFTQLKTNNFSTMRNKIIIDTRNVLPYRDLKEAGFEVTCLGVGIL
jgi:UDP-N-acetyl-D-mannosaminuronic acid dehydrogenase